MTHVVINVGCATAEELRERAREHRAQAAADQQEADGDRRAIDHPGE